MVVVVVVTAAAAAAGAGRGLVANAQVPALCPATSTYIIAPPLTERTHRLHQRGYRRANTQHCRIYDVHGLAPTVNGKYNERHKRVGRRDQGASATTEGAGSASGAQPFPTGRIVATRLIGNAIPPALVVALFR